MDTEPTETTGSTGIEVTPNFGDAEVTIDVPTDVASDAYQSYQQAVAEGYTDSFDTYLFNHTSATWSITVNGDPLGEVLAETGE